MLPQEQRPIDWLSVILLHDSVLTPLRVSSLFVANQYHSKCVLSFQTNRCAEPDIHYVDKVIFIRWYFVGQTMVDNVCGDRKQVIAVNDPNSSLNYPLVPTNKMAVPQSYLLRLPIIMYDHWSLISILILLLQISLFWWQLFPRAYQHLVGQPDISPFPNPIQFPHKSFHTNNIWIGTFGSVCSVPRYEIHIWSKR